MKKRLFSMLLAAAMLLPLLPMQAQAADTVVKDYVQNGDFCVISPAERWSGNNRVPTTTSEWELCMEGANYGSNGKKIHLYKYGTTSEFRIDSYSNGIFRFKTYSFQGTEGYCWDVKGKKEDPGTVIHVWSDSGQPTKKFCLIEDGDGDGETFYIKNVQAKKFIAPKNYFKGNNSETKGSNWDSNKTEVVLSTTPFRWRVQVINRDAAKNDKYANWMGRLPDDRYLSSINIPGTHDSATTNISISSEFSMYECQKYFIIQQLYSGIRCLDIRTKKSGNQFVLHHGSGICKNPSYDGGGTKTLRHVFDQIIGFLKEHPTETVVMTLKLDDSKHAKDLANFLLGYLEDNKTKDYFYQWWSNPEKTDIATARKGMQSPTLGQTRGKIVILSRAQFADLKLDGSKQKLVCSYAGPDVSMWDDELTDKLIYSQEITKDSGVSVMVQDAYQATADQKKVHLYNTVAQLNGNLANAPTVDEKAFVFNYTSSSFSISKSNYATPHSIAESLNNFIQNDQLFTAGSQAALRNPRTGYVIMDYVDKQLARRIIDRNDFSSSSERETYKITYVKNGGVIENEANYTSYSYGESLVLPTPTKPGYQFERWYYPDEMFKFLKHTATATGLFDSGNKVYYAEWTKAPSVTYSVDYRTNGGRIENEENYTTYTVGTKLTLPTPVRDGYQFMGWYTDSSFVNGRVTAILAGTTGDCVYYAKWKENF